MAKKNIVYVERKDKELECLFYTHVETPHRALVPSISGSSTYNNSPAL